MINFTAINCTGMFSFGMMSTIKLDNRGLIFLSGINNDRKGSNGSGKSSFINSIKEICFGENDTGKSGPNVVNKNKKWKNGCFGAIWLSDNNSVSWRIFMLRKWKNDPPDSEIVSNSELINNGEKYVGTDVFLERWNGELWVDERATSTGNKSHKDTQIKIIEEILDMTYEQFSAYVCLGQKAESALVSGTSNKREKIIQSVANVSNWDTAANLARERINTCNIVLSNKMAALSSSNSILENMQIPNKDEISIISGQINDSNNQLVALKSQLIVKQQELDELLKSSDSDLDQGLQLLNAERRHSNERLANSELPSPSEIILKLENRRVQIQAELSFLRKQHSTIKNLGEGICNNCGQNITGEHIGSSLSSLELKLKELDIVLEEVNVKHKKEMSKYNTIVEKLKQEVKDKYDHEIYCLDQTQEELIRRMNQYKDKINSIKIETNNLQSDINQLNVNISNFKSKLCFIEGQINHIKQVKEKIAQLQVAVFESEKDIKHWKWVERNLKKIKLQEYNIAIDRLNQLISLELQIIWGSEINARFVTAQEKARGKGVKQGFELVVTEPDKEDVPIELWSGGENKIIVIAIFIAMRKLTRERGCGVNISVIDELDKDLCDVNVDRMVNAFEHVTSDSSTCIVVSHNTRLLSIMEFNNTLTAEKTNGITKIVEGVI